MTVYRGDTNGKRLVRAYVYEFAVVLATLDRFVGRHHVVLAGPIGGDIGVLRALGVPFDRIVACDENRKAVKSCKERWPEATVIHAPVDEVVAEYAPTIQTCNLDFFGSLTIDRLRLVRKVASLLPAGALLAVTMLRGRESPGGHPLIIDEPPWGENRRERRIALQKARGLLRRGSTEPALLRLIEDPFERLNFGIDNGIALDCNDLLHRFHALVDDKLLTRGAPRGALARATMLQFASETKKAMCQPWLLMDYQSSSKQSKGSPMTVWVARVGRQRVKYDNLMFRRVKDQLRISALAFPGDGALFYNVAPKTLAAWRAHGARGSYRGAKTAMEARRALLRRDHPIYEYCLAFVESYGEEFASAVAQTAMLDSV